MPPSERSIPCPGCDGSAFRPVFVVGDLSGTTNALVRCCDCSLVVVAREPSLKELLSCYSEYSYGNEEAWRVSDATEASLVGLAAQLDRFRTDGRLLDVGCGAGAILSVMTRLGWLAEGTEVSRVAAARLREIGHRVHLGELHELGLPERSYDVVIMSEILEHLLTPRNAVLAARRLLRPGGALYLTTPNFDALSRRLLGERWKAITLPEHIRYFNRQSMTLLLMRAGLKAVSVVTQGLSPLEVLATLRSEAGARSVVGGTEALRRMSMGSGPLTAVKNLVNAFMRATNLGDTVKALAIRPCDGS